VSAGAGLVGRIVAIVALAVLPLLLLLDWYRVGVDVSGAVGSLVPLHAPSQDFTGWQAFTSSDVAIVVIADLAVLALALSPLTASRLPLALATAGALALVAMLAITAASPPDIVGERLDQLLPFQAPPLELPHNGILDAGIETKSLVAPWIALAAAIVALGGCLTALLVGAGPMTRRCPDCARLVSSQARVCRFCGHRFEPADLASPEPAH
jgi:hypothetical protein